MTDCILNLSNWQSTTFTLLDTEVLYSKETGILKMFDSKLSVDISPERSSQIEPFNLSPLPVSNLELLIKIPLSDSIFCQNPPSIVEFSILILPFESRVLIFRPFRSLQ